MNIMELLNNSLVQWGLGLIVGVVIFEYFRRIILFVVHKITEKLNHQIYQIKNEAARQVAKDVVRYIAEKMPDVSNSTKLKEAIKLLQELTPDIILSDNKVRILIESAYNELKKELGKIK